MNYDQAFEILIGHEGEFTDDKNDRGNWTSGKIGVGELKGTKYGISAMAYPDLNIRNLTLDEAKAIYARDYWGKLALERVPPQVRFDIFDTAVNSGISTAAKLLQRAVGVNDDGVIGAKTLAAVARISGDALDKKFNGQRLLFLAEIKTWPHYGRGWVRRVANNLISD